MSRFLGFCITLVTVQPVFAQESGGQGNEIKDRLWEVLEISSLMPVLQDEAVVEATGMEGTLFRRGGTGQWIELVKQIHDPKRLEDLFREGADKKLDQFDSRLIEKAEEFYESDLGKRILAKEFKVRIDFVSKETEDKAKLDFARAEEEGSSRVDLINRLIDEADLIEPNVAGGMNAIMAFSRGFSDGGGYPMPMDHQQILTYTIEQEPQLRSDTQDWIGAYLMTAYAPLSDAELERFIDFSVSPEGRALSEAMFSGFDLLYNKTSYELGMAAASQISGREL